MSDSNNTLKNKFQGFTIEVADDAIDENWKKIRYSLPQKRKKKRILFYRRFFLFGFFGSLVTLAFCFGLSYVTEKAVAINTTTQQQAIIKQKSTITNPSLPESNELSVKQDFIKEPNESDPKLNESFHKNNNLSKMVGANLLSTAHLNKKETLNHIQHKDEIVQNKQSNDTQLSYSSDKTTDIATHDNMMAVSIINLLSGNTDSEITASIQPSLYNDSIQPQKLLIKTGWNVELFFGINNAKTTVTDLKYNFTNHRLNANVHAGTSLNYTFKNKLIIASRFAVSQNKLDYMTIKTKNVIVAQSSLTTTTSSFVNTTTKYLQATEELTLKSTNSQDIALGVGYSAIQKKQYAVEAYMMLDMKFSKYNFSRHSTLSTDTLFSYSNSNQPFSGVGMANYNDRSESKTISTIQVGLLPALNINYVINKSFMLIIKPSYFIDLSKTEIKINDPILQVKQNNLYVNLGLRLNL